MQCQCNFKSYLHKNKKALKCTVNQHCSSRLYLSFNVQLYTVIIYTTWQVMYEIFKFTPLQMKWQAENEKGSGRYILDFTPICSLTRKSATLNLRHHALAAAL